MADAWAKLKEGSVRKFCFMHLHLLNRSEIAHRNTPKNTETSLGLLFKEVERHVNSHGGRTWNLTDGEGLFGFYDDELTKMADRAVASAVDVIDDLKNFNTTKSWVKQQIHVRISVHLGDAVYCKDTSLISGDEGWNAETVPQQRNCWGAAGFRHHVKAGCKIQTFQT